MKARQSSGDPVISVDTKKKDLIGEFKNAGREWRHQGEPVTARTHDFAGDSLDSALPSGMSDVSGNTGWVNVGTERDTAAYAVETLRRWWESAGSSDCPLARRLLITADAGGSDGDGTGRGALNWPRWQPRPRWRSPTGTARAVRRSGTRSSTGCYRPSR